MKCLGCMAVRLQSLRTKKKAPRTGEAFFFDMVRPERFELPTSWFVARRSIQLSYGRKRKTWREREGLLRASMHFALRASKRSLRDHSLFKFVPTNLSNPRVGFKYHPTKSLSNERARSPFIRKWRRERDSNPRWAFDPYALSRGAPSTTRPSLRTSTLWPVVSVAPSARVTPYILYFALRAIVHSLRDRPMFKFAPGNFVDHSAISPQPNRSISH
jgi:hypothetical protein